MLKHVDDTLAIASVDLCRRLLPNGFDVLPHDTAPGTLEAVSEYWFKNHKIAVSSYMSPRRFFGTAEACRCFDAWHDYCHANLQAPFTMKGEERVNDMQQAHLMLWYHKWCTLPVTEDAIKRASAMLNMNNLGRLQHWHQWDAPPADTRSFADGWLAALGMACKPKLVGFGEPDPRNEWTLYADREDG